MATLSNKGVLYVGILLLIVVVVTAVDVNGPEWVSIYETDDVGGIFNPGEEIVVDLEINVTGALPANTNVKVALRGVNRSKYLVDLLDYQGIDYSIEYEDADVTGQTDNAFFAFNGSGSQVLYLLVDTPEDEIVGLSMDVTGSGNPLPTLPYLDFGADGTVDWQFFGVLDGYSDDFVLPIGLDETKEDSEALLPNDDSQYWCEEIILPVASDIKVYAKMGDNNNGENVKATVFKMVTPGCTSNCDVGAAVGGCSFVLDGTSTKKYYSCEINADASFTNEKHLVCVYNNVDGNGATYQARLSMEGDGVSSGYTCSNGASSNNTPEITCDANPSDDFFIKVKGGEYSGTLDGTADFDEGLVGTYPEFLAEMNSVVGDCLELRNGDCAIPMSVGSLSRGILSLQNLQLFYKVEGGGTTKSTNKFYMGLNLDNGAITEIDGSILDEGMVLEMDTSGLFLYAPSNSGIYELNISFEPGPRNSTDVMIGSGGMVFNGTNMAGVIEAYIGYFEDLQDNSGDIISFLGWGERIDDAIDDLDTYLAFANTLNYSNKTEAEEFGSSLVDNLNTIVAELPNTISVLGDVNDIIIAEPKDIIPEIFSGNEEEAMNAYYIQSDFVVNGRARYVSVELFDGTIIEGTVIEKTINGPGSNYNVYELVPRAIVSDPENDMAFKDDFALTNEGVTAVFYKKYTSVNSESYSYFVHGDISSALSALKTIILPTAGVTAQGLETIPICGDNKCDVLLIDGVKYPLEDMYSCPEDCSKVVNWTGILLVLMIGVLLIAAIYLFFKFRGKNGLNFKLHNKGDTDKKMMFSNVADENNLRDYVVKVMAKGMKREQVTSLLMKKGWKKEQIDYVFSSASKIKPKK
ncbi:MAG: hypothetical protein Q8Q42_04175 [Nanoarchaeota archaeon]|nr:hypothetical protein [Nanoarchaeota archaeon]